MDRYKLLHTRLSLLSNKYDVEKPDLEFNFVYDTSAGYYSSGSHTITISLAHVNLANGYELLETLDHEFGHVIQWNQGFDTKDNHGNGWKSAMSMIGYTEKSIENNRHVDYDDGHFDYRYKIQYSYDPVKYVQEYFDFELWLLYWFMFNWVLYYWIFIILESG